MIGATPPSSICTGANRLPGKGAGGSCVSLRPIPRKGLFFRRGAQTFCREEAPAAVGVCAPLPGKAYFSVEGRKHLALHEFLWDSYLKLSLIFNWNAPSDPRCEDFFAGIVLAAIERASLG